ncbi:hypothetical protein F5879DRAFT_996729 [Lentinula edodes]|nr:hypothetical protein F5879DRAFT_996729 [Lentinula edodes]
MSATRTTTTTTNQPTASTSSRPANPPSPGAPIDEDEDEIIREALARVERVKARKAAEAAKKKAAEEAAARKAAEEAERKKRAAAQAAVARRQAAQDARDRANRAQEQEDGVVERRRKLAAAATARSQGGTSTGETSASPRRPVVEIPRTKSKGKAKAQPVGEDPDDGDDGDEDDDDEEDREPCESTMFVLGSSIHRQEGGRRKSERRTAGRSRKSDGAGSRRQSGSARSQLKVPPGDDDGHGRRTGDGGAVKENYRAAATAEATEGRRGE